MDAGWPQAEVARHFRVSRHTVAKWLGRFRAEGAAGLEDRSSAPRAHPRRTPPELERRICAVRRTQGFGPHRIQWALGVARSAVYAVLRRRGLNRLDRLHRVTREPVRYEHDAPGDLLHLDVKKLGASPRAAASEWRLASPRRAPGRIRGVRWGWSTYTSPSTTTAVTPTSPSCPTSVARVLTDNAKAYTVARSFHGAAAAADVRLSHTRPYRPQTNGKAERFIQILQNEWAYARPYRSNAERLRQLPRWLYRYNHRRPHGGVGGAVPASRL